MRAGGRGEVADIKKFSTVDRLYLLLGFACESEVLSNLELNLFLIFFWR